MFITGNCMHEQLSSYRFTVPVWPQHVDPTKASAIQAHWAYDSIPFESSACWALALVPTDTWRDTQRRKCIGIQTQKYTGYYRILLTMKLNKQEIEKGRAKQLWDKGACGSKAPTSTMEKWWILKTINPALLYRLFFFFTLLFIYLNWKQSLPSSHDT